MVYYSRPNLDLTFAALADPTRRALLARLSALGPQVLESPDVERVCAALRRLLTDIAHHVQRVHDLAYDAVELELGGSE